MLFASIKHQNPIVQPEELLQCQQAALKAHTGGAHRKMAEVNRVLVVV